MPEPMTAPRAPRPHSAALWPGARGYPDGLSSFATLLVPLRRDAQVFGLLALGSQETERFYPEMGTLYVSRIGDLVASALRRQLG